MLGKEAIATKMRKSFKGFLNGVTHFSTGVGRFSSKCVTACSRDKKKKYPKFKLTQELEEYPAFTNIAFKLLDKKKDWTDVMRKVRDGMEGAISCALDKDGVINISGYIDPDQFLKTMKKLRYKIEVEHMQDGICSSNLYKKKNPPTNKANTAVEDSRNKANTAVGYYQPQSYGYYYGNVGFNGNGGYNGNSYNYQLEPAVYQKRIGYDHIDCAGDASECSGVHHIRKAATPDKTQDKSSKNTVEKPAGSPKRN